MKLSAGDIQCKAIYKGEELLWSITSEWEEEFNKVWDDSLVWDDNLIWNE